MSVYTVHACFLACIETSFLFSQTRIYWPIGAWPGPPTFSTSDTEASQSAIKPGISCTAGEHSMQRASRTAWFTACITTAPPKPRCRELLIGDRGWVACEGAGRSNLRTAWELHLRWGDHYVGGLTRATYILCIEHPRSEASQSGIEHSMQRAIPTAL